MIILDPIIDIAIDRLKGMSIFDRIKRDFDSVRKYQEAIYIYANNPDEKKINIIRIGTILSLSIIGKILQGKNAKDFNPEDWRDIADNVVDYGIIMDGQSYTAFIFTLYAVYIDFSVEINTENISEGAADDIRRLSEEIKEATAKLRDGQITEPDYVDSCLWSAFEAIIKLLAAYTTKGIGEEYEAFLRAIADFSVQYGRYKLYERELNLVNEYIEKQEVLDEELDKKYSAYINELQAESDKFNELLNHAFCDDFEDMLRSSVDLAREIGVDESKILDSQEKIDSFFTE